MRVAHLGNFNPDSADGTEKTIAGLVSWLPRHGIDVEVWQLVWGRRDVGRRTTAACTVWELPAYPPPRSFVRGLTPAARAFVVERVGQRVVTHVHFHSGFIPENSAVARLLKVPYVVAPNGMYSPANLAARDARFKRLWLRWRELPFLGQAALLHAVSEGEAAALRELVPRVPTRLVPNALDLPDVPWSEPPRRDLLFLGRLAVEQKGLDLLLQAYARYLAASGDTATRLLLVGPDYRGGRSSLQRLVRTLDLAGRVEIREPVFGAAKWQLLASAFAVVYPSRWDGLPFSVLEALAVHRPVLVTPGTNLAELVSAYDAGEVTAASVSEIAAGLARLVGTSPERWRTLAQHARRLVADHFTWDRAAAQMAHAYHELADATEYTAVAR